jgi:hypothetical protein
MSSSSSSILTFLLVLSSASISRFRFNKSLSVDSSLLSPPSIGSSASSSVSLISSSSSSSSTEADAPASVAVVGWLLEPPGLCFDEEVCRFSCSLCLMTALSKNSLKNFLTARSCLDVIARGSETRPFLKSEFTSFFETYSGIKVSTLNRSSRCIRV